MRLDARVGGFAQLDGPGMVSAPNEASTEPVSQGDVAPRRPPDTAHETPIDHRFLRSYLGRMPKPPVRAPFLGELELAVMNHVWAGRDGDAKSVHERLGKKRGITLNTIQSTLKRLYEKGLLARDKVSHAHVYRARVSREAFHRGLIDELVGGMMKTHADSVVAAFVDVAEQAGPATLERLEALVAQRLRTKGRGD